MSSDLISKLKNLKDHIHDIESSIFVDPKTLLTKKSQRKSNLDQKLKYISNSQDTKVILSLRGEEFTVSKSLLTNCKFPLDFAKNLEYSNDNFVFLDIDRTVFKQIIFPIIVKFNKELLESTTNINDLNDGFIKHIVFYKRDTQLALIKKEIELIFTYKDVFDHLIFESLSN